jgi:hypothetical protein
MVIDSIGLLTHGQQIRRLDRFLFVMEILLRRYPMNQTYNTSGLGLYEINIDKILPLARPLTDRQFLSAVGAADILIVGEDHGRNAARQALIDLLPQLKKASFTHLAVELIAVDDRPLLKAFEERKPESEKALRDFLADENNTGLMAEFAGEYLALLGKFAAAGCSLEPLTHPKVLEPWHKQIREQPFFFFADNLDIRFRDIFMCLTLEYLFRQTPNARVAALVGLGHSDADSGMPVVLREEFGRKTLSLAVCQRAGVKEPFLIEFDERARKIIPAYTSLNHRAYDQFPKPGDWVLFAPDPLPK